MKLLVELAENTEIVQEANEEGKKSTFIVGPFISANQKNRNGRYYPGDIIENEVARYKKEYIDQNRALGEMNHPPSAAINFIQASHIIKELNRKGDLWIGKAKILEDLPMGKIAKGLVDEKIPLGVSTRGMGSLREDEKLQAKVVGADFRLCACDIVSDPSGIGCIAQGIMENVDWIYDAATDSYVQETLEDVKAILKATPKSEMPKASRMAFERFLIALDPSRDLIAEEAIPLIAQIVAEDRVPAPQAWKAHQKARQLARQEGRSGDAGYVAKLTKRFAKQQNG